MAELATEVKEERKRLCVRSVPYQTGGEDQIDFGDLGISFIADAVVTGRAEMPLE